MTSERVIARRPGVVFVRIPREEQRSCGRCDCPHCKGTEGFWDTLAVPTVDDGIGHTWTCHMPVVPEAWRKS